MRIHLANDRSAGIRKSLPGAFHEGSLYAHLSTRLINPAPGSILNQVFNRAWTAIQCPCVPKLGRKATSHWVPLVLQGHQLAQTLPIGQSGSHGLKPARHIIPMDRGREVSDGIQHV